VTSVLGCCEIVKAKLIVRWSVVGREEEPEHISDPSSAHSPARYFLYFRFVDTRKTILESHISLLEASGG